MIKIFGLRILTKKDVEKIQVNYDIAELKFKEIDAKLDLLFEFTDSLNDLILEVSKDLYEKKKPTKKTKK